MSLPIAIPARRCRNMAPSFDSSPQDDATWDQCSTKTRPLPCRRQSSVSTNVDSGYATGNNTSFVSLDDKDQLLKNRLPLPEQRVRSVPLPGKEELQLFRTDMDEIVNARFREIAPEMQRRLVQSPGRGLFQLSRTKTRRRELTMSMRLMMVGTSVENAVPSIVIFLPSDGVSRVEAGLGQPFLRQLYEPDDNGLTPSFKVIVVGQAPRKRRRRQDVHVVYENSRFRERDLPTYCGVQISLRSDHSSIPAAMATLGGIIKLNYGSGDFKLVGMTAAHALEDIWDDALEMEDNPDEYGEDLLTKTNPLSKVRDDNIYAYAAHSKTVGKVLHPSLDNGYENNGDVTIPKYDWALFNIDDSQFKIRPNIIHQAGVHVTNPYPRRPARSGTGHSLTNAAPPESFPSTQPIEVVLLGGGSKRMLGHLSHLPGGIMLSADYGFVDAYLLILDEGLALEDGDSGSWVVNPISLEVYGHVVATDLTGDAYVIPMYQSFREMKDVLGGDGVESVELPDTADLLESALRLRVSGAEGEGEAGKQREGTLVLEHEYGRRRRERRVPEEGLYMSDRWSSDVMMKRLSGWVSDDGDSGYGSLGSTPFGAVSEVEP